MAGAASSKYTLHYSSPFLFICLKRVPVKACLGIIFLFLFLAGQISCWLYHRNGMDNEIHPYINSHFPSFLDSFSFGVLLAGLESYWGGLPKSWGRLGDVGLILLAASLLTGAWWNFHQIR